jgi:hypothetical protein
MVDRREALAMPEDSDDRRFIIKLHLPSELAEPIKIVARAKGISAPKLVESWVRRLVEKNEGAILAIAKQLNDLDLD